MSGLQESCICAEESSCATMQDHWHWGTSLHWTRKHGCYTGRGLQIFVVFPMTYMFVAHLLIGEHETNWKTIKQLNEHIYGYLCQLRSAILKHFHSESPFSGSKNANTLMIAAQNKCMNIITSHILLDFYSCFHLFKVLTCYIVLKASKNYFFFFFFVIINLLILSTHFLIWLKLQQSLLLLLQFLKFFNLFI